MERESRSSRGRGRGRGRGRRGRGRGRGRGRRRGSTRGGRGKYTGRDRDRPRVKPKKRNTNLKTKTVTTDSKDVTVTDIGTVGVATEELFAKQDWKPHEKEMESITNKFSELNTESVQQILLGQNKDMNTVQHHIYCVEYNRNTYIGHIEAFIKFKVMSTLSTAAKAKLLIALIISNEKEMVHQLLYTLDPKTNTIKANINYYSVPDIAKVIQLLDAPRLARQYLKEVHKLENKQSKQRYHPLKKKKKLLLLKNKIHNLQKDGDSLHSGSLSGAKQKFFAKWIKSIDRNQLSFFLLNFPKTNWRYICDLIHTNPEKDFPSKMTFFQKVIFSNNDEDDEKLMDKDSLVYNAKRVNRDNLVELLTKYPYLSQCYSYLRRRLLVNDTDGLPDQAKLILSEYAPLPDLLWWYDEFEMDCIPNQVENNICRRLSDAKDELIFTDDVGNKSNYGKLMERLLKFLEERRRFAPLLIDHVQNKLYTIPRITDILSDRYEFRIAIFGDASASMNVAIKTASILSSLMSYALCADLLFFNKEPFDPPCIPRNVRETIEVVTKVKGKGTTSMASALYPYYIHKIKVDLFILVSDEGENRRYRGYYFAQLFALYRKEINNKAKLFLVSFLHQSINGLIMTRLIAKGIAGNDVKQIRLHPLNPDTSKFDGLLGVASLMLSSIARDNDMRTLSVIQQSIFDVLMYTISHEITQFNNDFLCQHISGLIYDYLRGLPRKSVLQLGGFGSSLDTAFAMSAKAKGKESKKDKEELDLVFCMDCTSSMGSYIAKAKEAIQSIVCDINKNDDVDVQFGYIAYRDHPPQDRSFVYKIYPFTQSTEEMSKYVSAHGASGGGDIPEAVTAGLNAAIADTSANKLNWRPSSVRIVVLIADAPPHGLGGGGGDRIPGGDPNGLDPIKVARRLAENGIVLYVVACEPSLSSVPRAHDLMAGLAKITEGSFLPLASAKLLPDIIVGGAAQEISLQRLTREIETEYNENIKKNLKNLIEDNNWSEIYKQISIGLNKKGVTYSKFEIDDIYGDYNTINIDKCVYAESLAQVKAEWENVSQPTINYHSISEQTAKSQESTITPEIVKTVMNRLLNQW